MFLAISLGHIFKIADTRLEISHNNADLKLPLVIMDLCILLLYQLFESFWFNKEYLVLLVFSKKVFL